MEQAEKKLGVLPECPICDTPSRYEFSGRDLMFDLHERYDYNACPTCGGVFQSPMPDMETIATFYPETYTVFDQESRTRSLSRLKKAVLQRGSGEVENLSHNQ